MCYKHGVTALLQSHAHVSAVSISPAVIFNAEELTIFLENDKLYGRNLNIPHFSSVVQMLPASDKSEAKWYERNSYRRNRIIYAFRLLSLRLTPPADQKPNSMN